MACPFPLARFGGPLAALLTAWWGALLPVAQGALMITTTVSNPSAFTPTQLQIVETALAQAEAMWESVIVGYQPGIGISSLPITVVGQTTGFASAQVLGTTTQGGFRLTTTGRINVNTTILEEFSNFRGNGTNVIDELMAHEIGHLLGIGTHWVANGVYTFGSGRYTGAHGLKAYREEFDSSAQWVPVELAGNPGTPNAHWDQLMRSSSQEGNPDDPFSLDPRLGIVDGHGRDLALELMTGAIDPDYGEPFLSRTTVQSLRDLGFVVVPEPTGLTLWTLVLLSQVTRSVSAGRIRSAKRQRGPNTRICRPSYISAP
jgi:hypothetical protein